MTPERYAQVTALFHAARERAPHDQTAFLDHACAADLELRREVASLLAAAEGAPSESDWRRVIAGAADDARPDAARPDAVRPVTEFPDEGDLESQLRAALADRYAVGREIGRGGMAVVYLADDLRHGRAVAVKVLHPDLVASVNAERFLREIRVAAGLTHPHVVPLFDSGRARVDRHGASVDLPYYVMPFVPGESLRAALARGGALPVADARRVLREVADALAAAHAQGVAHRDIKPENVLLSGGHALVTDFGIAKALTAARRPDGEGATLTGTGVVLGTPAYMAPEQAVGEAHDERVDLYALGALGYELLAGRPPFGDVPTRQLVYAHVALAPRPVGELRPDAPPALAALVMQCLAKEPDARPPDAATVVRALDGLDSPDGPAADARARPGGGRARYAAAALGIAALAAAAFVLPRALGLGPSKSLLAAGTLTAQDRLLVTDFRATGRDTSLGDVVAEAVRTDLVQAGGVTAVPTTSVAAALRRMRREPDTPLDLPLAQELAQREGIKAIVDGDVRSVGQSYVITLRLVTADSGHELFARNETADGDAAFIPAVGRLTRQLREEIGESFDRINAAPPLERVTTGSLEALRKYTEAVRASERGDPAKAIPLLEDAVALDSTFAMAYSRLAAAIGTAGVESARLTDILRRVCELRDRLSEPEQLLADAQCYSTHLGVFSRPRTLAAHEALVTRYPHLPTPYNSLGLLLGTRREFGKAEAQFRRAIERFPEYGAPHTNIVSAQINQGRLDAAQASADLAARRFPESPRLLGAHVAVLYHRFYQSGRLDSVVADVRRRQERGTPQDRLAATQLLSQLMFLGGRVAEGQRLAAAYVGTSRSRGQRTPVLADAILAANVDVWLLNRRARAAGRLDAALAAAPLQGLPRSTGGYYDVAAAYALAGRPDRARALIAQVNAATADARLLRPFESIRQNAEGEIALAEGHAEQAITLFQRADEAADGPAHDCSICLYERLARAYDAAGRADSAVVWYERYVTTPLHRRIGWESWYLPRAFRRLGELHEAAGHRDLAATNYARFVELWKGADAELQPQVAAARQALDRVRQRR